MASVNFPANVGGDGSTVSDDSSPTTGLENYGWRTRLVPAFSQIVAIATWVKNRALDVAGYANTSQQAASTATSALNAITALGVNPAGYAALSGAAFTGTLSADSGGNGGHTFASLSGELTQNANSSDANSRNFALGQLTSYGTYEIKISATKGGNAKAGPTIAGFSSTGLAVTGMLGVSGNGAFKSNTSEDVLQLTYSTLGKVAGVYLDSSSAYYGAGSNNYSNAFIAGHSTNYAAINVAGSERARIDASGNLLPGADGTQAFGSTSLRWSQVWCTAGAFNTSNATLKTPIRTMQAKELAAGYQMAQELGTFQWLESVKEKGDKARRHVGLTVQRAAEIMESHGLKPWSYGFMGYDKWDAVTEIVDATEDDDGAYQEEVTRQKTEKQTSQKQTVEVVNGKPTLKVETIETDVPVTEQIQVVDADGNPVFTDVEEVPAVLDEEGNEVTPSVPAHQVPMMHAVPVMETVTVWKRVKEVRPAGESYAFRSDQLAFFIAAGVAAKVAA